MGGGYNLRRQECERACALLGVASLRELSGDGASTGRLERVEILPDPERKRARHVVTENERVLEAVEALRRGDGEMLGNLFARSQVSMRDDFEVTISEIDTLVDLTGRQEGVFGARMTGGGFGGSIVAMARRGTGLAAARRAAEAYLQRTGLRAAVIVPEA